MNPLHIYFFRLNFGIKVCVLLCLLCFLLALRANAQLYPWSINEIYSSSDGTIQFIELNTQDAPNGLLGSGYMFTSWNAAETVSHSYYSEVSQFSGGGNQTLLFATSGFTHLPGAITPDYIMPEGFLFTPAGKLTVQTYGLNLSSSLSYSDLPIDATEALDANGDIVSAIAENFAGQVYAVPEPSVAVLIFGGLSSLALLHRAKKRD